MQEWVQITIAGVEDMVLVKMDFGAIFVLV